MHDLLVSRAALPYLEVSAPAGRHHAELGPVRREALDVLASGYRSPARLLLGLIAWAAVLGGTVVLALGPSPAAAVGAVVLVLAGLALGVVVLRAGARLTRAAAGWLQVPVVGASGRDAGSLYGVVRGRAALGLLAGVLTVTLFVVVVWLLSGSGALAAANLGRPVGTAALDVGRGVVAGIGTAAAATAVVAVASFGGCDRRG